MSMVTIGGKKYIEYTRKCIDTAQMTIFLAPEHLDAAKRIGGSVSKGIRLVLRHFYRKEMHWDRPTSELVTDKNKGITTSSNYRRICISITPASKEEASAISQTTVIEGIRIALEHAATTLKPE